MLKKIATLLKKSGALVKIVVAMLKNVTALLKKSGALVKIVAAMLKNVVAMLKKITTLPFKDAAWRDKSANMPNTLPAKSRIS